MGMTNSITPIRFNMAPATELPNQVRPYVPPKARDEAEIARLKSPGRPKGTLILERQADGIDMISQGFRRCETPEQFRQWADIAKYAAVGSALYMLEDPTGETAQRYTQLPKLGAARPELRPTANDLRVEAMRAFDQAYIFSLHLVGEHVAGRSQANRKQAELATAKTLIHAAFLADCVEVADITSNPDARISNHEAQLMGRDQGLGMLQAMTSLAVELDFLPTTGQLKGDPYSPYVVAINQTGEDFPIELHAALAA